MTPNRIHDERKAVIDHSRCVVKIIACVQRPTRQP